MSILKQILDQVG